MHSKKEISRNFITFVFSDLVVLLLGLVSRALFIKNIGDYFLGITTIMNSIIGMLALSNLGLGDAIVYCLIEKFSKKEVDEIRSVYSFSKKVFKIIMLVLIAFSLLLLPFLNFFVKDIRDYNAFIVYYAFFVSSKVLTYQIGPYNAVIRADQKIRVVQFGTLLGYIISTILQIVAMLINGSYFIYVFLMLIGTVITNIYISMYFHKHYQWVLNGNNVLNKNEKRFIFRKVKDVFITRVSSSLIDTSDNLLITKFIGTETVGMYGNYVMIIQNVRQLAKNLYNSMESSIGLQNYRSESQAKLAMYKNILFIYHILGSIFSIGIAVLMQEFITIWIGNNHLLSYAILYIMAFDLYINILTYAQTGFINTSDVYSKIKTVYFIGAILNVIFSIILVYHYGLVGIIMGTLLSRLVCNFPLGIYYLCKDQFKSSVKGVLFLNIGYALELFAMYFITYFIVSNFKIHTFFGFAIKGVLVVFITLCLNIVLNIRKEELSIYKNKVGEIVRKLLKHGN